MQDNSHRGFLHSCTFFCVYAGLVDFCRKPCYFDVKINAQLTTVSYLVLGIGAQMLKYRPNINPIKSIRLEAYQMSTMKKRIPMFLLALAMMVAMAVPAFAASYRPNAQFGYLLNINGSTGSAYQGRALNLMKTDTMGTDQNFIIGTRKGYTGYYMMVTANVNYAVNRSDNGGRAIIWPLSTGSADSRLADNSESVIRLYTSRELLTAREPVGDWSTVYFGGSGISVWVRVH